MATYTGIAALLLWSSLALLAAKTTNTPPFLLLAICFAIGALTLITGRSIKQKQRIELPNMSLQQWLLGIYGLFGYHFCYFLALRYAPVLEVSLINYLWPLLLALFVAQPGNRSFAAIGSIVAFAGIAVLLSGDQASFNLGSIVGYALALCAAIIWACYSFLLTKQRNNNADIGWISLAVSALALICHLLFEQRLPLSQTSPWLEYLLIGLGPLGCAFLCWEVGLKKGNKQLLASLSFFTPLLSAIWLALFGYNPWSSQIIMALTLILLGAFITNIKNVYRRRSPPLKNKG